MRLLDADVETKTALVTDRDRIPSTRLEDDESGRGSHRRGEVLGPARSGLLVDRADNNEAAGAAPRLAAHGCDRGGKRPLGINGASPVEDVAVTADFDVACDSIEVTHERDRLRTVAPGRNHITGCVDVNVEPRLAQTRHQHRRERGLLPAGARY